MDTLRIKDKHFAIAFAQEGHVREGHPLLCRAQHQSQPTDGPLLHKLPARHPKLPQDVLPSLSHVSSELRKKSSLTMNKRVKWQEQGLSGFGMDSLAPPADPTQGATLRIGAL